MLHVHEGSDRSSSRVPGIVSPPSVDPGPLKGYTRAEQTSRKSVWTGVGNRRGSRNYLNE